MEDLMKRQECNQSMQRVHERVDTIFQDVAEIKICAKIIKESVQDMHKVIFGNSREGLITKISNIFVTLKIHFWLISIIIIGLFGLAWRILAG